jgi:hypothetical protein
MLYIRKIRLLRDDICKAWCGMGDAQRGSSRVASVRRRFGRLRYVPLTTVVAFILIIASCSSDDGGAASEGFVTAWTQLGPDGAVLARAITGDAACPDAIVDGDATPMEVRVGPATDFPNTVCELTIPADTTSLRVEDLQLPLLADAGEVDPAVVALYQPEFAALPAIVDNIPTWFVTHAAMWAFIVVNEGGGPIQVVDTVNLQAASGNLLPEGIEVVLSGGTHGAQFLNFADGRPPQVVSGNGGDLLDPPLQQPLVGTEIAGTTVESGFSAAEFGYSVLERSGDEWNITFFDVGGDVLYTDSI